MGERFNFKNEKEIEEYVNEIITSKTSNKTDSFFDEMVRKLLKVIIMYVLEKEKEENQNLNRCIEIIEENMEKSPNECILSKKIDELGFGSPITLEYMSLKIMPEKDFKEIFANLREKFN